MSWTGLRWAAVQLWHPLNCNFLPMGRALFKGKKSECLKEFEQLHGGIPEEWFSELGGIFLNEDAIIPTTEREAKDLAAAHVLLATQRGECP